MEEEKLKSMGLEEDMLKSWYWKRKIVKIMVLEEGILKLS